MRHLTVIALLLPLFGSVATAQAQGMTVQLGGPHLECRPGWDFTAGSMQVHFSAGRIVALPSQPVRFEVDNACGNSRLTITLPSFVKNIQMRVAAGTFPAHVVGWGSVNPGGPLTPVNFPGPTSSIEVRSTGNGRVVVDQISFELGDQPALFSFGATTTGRVLTHKYRSDDAYPSALQTQDGKVRVEGLVHDLAGTTGIGGRKVYFRLIDPPDTADYVVSAGGAQIGDNADGPGALNGASTATDTSDSSGKVSVMLEITDHAAGDNYQVEASLYEDFSCSPAPCRTSIVYTAWKRVYVETDRMFRSGAYITADIAPCPTAPCFVPLNNLRGIHRGDTLRLIHAPRSSIVGPQPFYSEDVRVARLDHKNDRAEVTPYQRTYFGPDTDSNGVLRPFLADAAGIITGVDADDFFTSNKPSIPLLFEGTFVEYVFLDDDPVPYLPFEEQVMGSALIGEETRELARKWFFHFDRFNHQHLLGGRTGSSSGLQGLTTARIGTNWSWIFVQTVTDASPRRGGGEALFNSEVTAHEIAHQWQVNSGTATGGHCNWFRWSSTTLYCTMHGDYGVAGASCSGTCPEFFDGQVGFHYQSATDSEFMTIRHRPDPIPQF